MSSDTVRQQSRRRPHSGVGDTPPNPVLLPFFRNPSPVRNPDKNLPLSHCT
jgi:hypothetical protein